MKAYVKPDVCYEDFQLSTHIARCDSIFKHGDGRACSGYVGEDVYTLFSGEACTLEAYCYENGSGAMGVFTS